MKNNILIILLALPSLITAQRLEGEFQKQLDSLYKVNSDAIGVLIHVESPQNKLSWSSAVGFSNKESKEQLDVEQPVLIASNTKPYVATAILRLVEDNKLKLNSPIEKLVNKKIHKKLKDDGYALDKITIKHLLSHTSGIADYVDKDYFDFVDKNPLYQWEKQEQIQRSIDIGDPLFSPGTEFKYGDINYLLLTDIIERITSKPFYTSMRELLKFDELNLNQTWFKNLEPYPTDTKPLAHQYAEKHDWDSYEFNPSWDLYGGGGLASTVKDVALFMQCLFEGKIIQDKNLLDQMTQYVLLKDISKYCLGIQHLTFPTFSAYYHGGWWGTDVAYCPETNSTIAVFTLQKAKRNEFSKMSIDMMKNLVDNSQLDSEYKSNEPEAKSFTKEISIYSNALGENRTIFIHKPPAIYGMDAEVEKMPVILVLDAEGQFNHTATTADFMSAATQGNDLMPRSLVIGITNPNRDFDLTPIKGERHNDPSTIENTGGGPLFLEFITKELLPYIDSSYSTSNHRTIIGHSLGGLLVFEALLRKRDYFTNYLTIDPVLGFANGTYLEQVLDTLRSADLSTENLFFASANTRPTFMSYESLRTDTSTFVGQIDKPNFDFIHYEETKDWSINLSKNHYEDESHFALPLTATKDAFRFFYSYYPFGLTPY